MPQRVLVLKGTVAAAAVDATVTLQIEDLSDKITGDYFSVAGIAPAADVAEVTLKGIAIASAKLSEILTQILPMQDLPLGLRVALEAFQYKQGLPPITEVFETSKGLKIVLQGVSNSDTAAAKDIVLLVHVFNEGPPPKFPALMYVPPFLRFTPAWEALMKAYRLYEKAGEPVPPIGELGF